MATQVDTDYFAQLDRLYASTPKLPLGDPNAPLVQCDEKGDVRVKDSRVHLYLILEDYLEHGATLEDLHERYTSLTVEEFAKIIEYYENNKKIVDEYLAHNKLVCSFVDSWMSEINPQHGLRDRLKARLNNGGSQNE